MQLSNLLRGAETYNYNQNCTKDDAGNMEGPSCRVLRWRRELARAGAGGHRRRLCCRRGVVDSCSRRYRYAIQRVTSYVVELEVSIIVPWTTCPKYVVCSALSCRTSIGACLVVDCGKTSPVTTKSNVDNKFLCTKILTYVAA